MKEVYIVFSGVYEDYRPQAVFDDSTLANDLRDKLYGADALARDSGPTVGRAKMEISNIVYKYFKERNYPGSTLVTIEGTTYGLSYDREYGPSIYEHPGTIILF